MIQKFRNHPYPKHFATYSINHLFYGLLISGLGPLIPYLSEKSGIIQTQYSFFFSCRSFGMLGGALILKLVQKHLSIAIHKQMILSALVIFVASWMFSSTESLFSQGVWMTVSAMSYSNFQIQLSVCILLTNPKQDVQFWMLLANGLFGVGGLIGPLIVYVFETNSFTIIGFIFLSLIPAYYLLPSPELQNPALENKDNATAATMQRITPRKIEILLCITLFIYIGLECTFGGWISSYSILAGVSNKQNATIYPSIFWLFVTIFRFILAFLPGTASQKMEKQLIIVMGCGVLSLIFIHIGYIQFACYFSAMIFGAALSSIYALILTFSAIYGFTLADYQTGNIIACGVLGEGFLTMFIGMLMEQIHINMLFYGMIIMALVMEIIRRFCVKFFEEAQPKARQKQVQLTQKFLRT